MRRFVGYGSLICENSARNSCPSLEAFELCEIQGIRRVFGKVDPHGTVHGLIDWDTLEVADCYACVAEADSMIGATFLVGADEEIADLYERECQYREGAITVHCLASRHCETASIFFGYDDESVYRRENRLLHYPRWPDFPSIYPGDVYRKDILPARYYLKRAMLAYVAHGRDMLADFIASSWLADQVTPLSEHLERIGWNVDNPDSWV